MESNPPECPVCLNDVSNGCRTACGHEFCTDCLLKTFKSRRPWHCGKCPVCRAPVSIYSTADMDGSPLVPSETRTIFGHTYVQDDTAGVGVGSYHFETPDDAYISFEAAPARWSLDDGRPLPRQKRFEDASYDAASRTFRGTVRWSEAPFEGDSRWECEMVFSDDFAVICGGQRKAFDGGGGQTSALSYPAELRYWRRRAPPDSLDRCVFVQPGLEPGAVSYHFEHRDRAYISYEDAPEHWSLDDGSPLPGKKRFENASYDEASRTFRGTIRWGASPWDGETRWEYEMTFSDDFSVISGGKVRGFHRRGALTSVELFGPRRSLKYELYVEEKARLRDVVAELPDVLPARRDGSRRSRLPRRHALPPLRLVARLMGYSERNSGREG